MIHLINEILQWIVILTALFLAWGINDYFGDNKK